MSGPPHKLATYADLMAVPDTKVTELIAGVLHVSPRPALPHAAASAALGEELGPPFKRGRGGPGGWIILDEPELHLGADVLVPDLGGWRRLRMPSLDERVGVEIAPDWVCEVLSPSTARLDRVDKLPRYAAAGVSHAWLVDPRARTLEVLANHSGQWLMVGSWAADARVRAVPFDAIELDLSILWQDVVLNDPPR